MKITLCRWSKGWRQPGWSRSLPERSRGAAVCSGSCCLFRLLPAAPAHLPGQVQLLLAAQGTEHSLGAHPCQHCPWAAHLARMEQELRLQWCPGAAAVPWGCSSALGLLLAGCSSPAADTGLFPSSPHSQSLCSIHFFLLPLGPVLCYPQCFTAGIGCTLCYAPSGDQSDLINL